MIETTYSEGNRPSAEQYNGLEQTLEGLRAFMGEWFGGSGFPTTPGTNAQVLEQSPTNTTQVRVLGPGLFWVDFTGTLAGGDTFRKSATENVTVPALNTIAGQSRNDLVIGTVNIGAINTYTYSVLQGTPATTGSQTDPTVPANSLKLARITRVHGAGNIVNAMITDLRALTPRG